MSASTTLPVVLHFKSGFLSGTETFVYSQIRNAETFHPVVLCRFRKQSPFALQNLNIIEEPGALPWKIERMLVGLYFSAGLTPKTILKKYYTTLQRIKPAVIHAHFGPDASYILPPAHHYHIPLITSFYGYDVSKFPKRFMGFANQFYKGLKKRGNCFLVMSKDMKADLLSLGFPEERIIIHHYGIDVERFRHDQRNHEPNDGRVKFLQVGTLGGKKAQIDVLKALAWLRQNNQAINIELNFVGSGPGESELRKFVEENGLSDTVHFLGFIPHNDTLVNLFKEHHVFIHPSVTLANGDKEGIPTTILEAMSSSMPVISTYHAGIPEAITNGAEGLLVREHHIQELANAMLMLSSDASIRREMGMKGNVKVRETYDIRNQIRKLEHIYNDVIERNRSERSS